MQFDLLLAESEFQRSALERRATRKIPGISCPIDVLQCDGLVLQKLVAGRIINRADAAALLRENRDVTDFDYLLSWLARPSLTTDFAEIWGEAFPDEDLPKSNA